MFFRSWMIKTPLASDDASHSKIISKHEWQLRMFFAKLINSRTGVNWQHFCVGSSLAADRTYKPQQPETKFSAKSKTRLKFLRTTTRRNLKFSLHILQTGDRISRAPSGIVPGVRASVETDDDQLPLEAVCQNKQSGQQMHWKSRGWLFIRSNGCRGSMAAWHGVFHHTHWDTAVGSTRDTQAFAL